MSAEGQGHDHPIAGLLWVLLCFGLIGVAAKAGIESSKKALINAEINVAIEHVEQKEIEKAEAILQDLVRKYPDNADVMFNLAGAQLAMNKLDEADQTFGRVLELAPKDYEALVYRAAIRKQKGQVEDALAMLEQVPNGEGNIRQQLVQNPVWADLAADPRMQALRQKHGLPPVSRDTSIYRQD